jgi:hypothetical protein
MGHVNMLIPDEIHKKMKVVCAQKEMTIIDFINSALREKLSREKM